jgi:hypothetical protein
MRTIAPEEMNIAIKLIDAMSAIDEELMDLGFCIDEENTFIAIRKNESDTVYGSVVPVMDWFEYRPKESIDG